MAVYLMKAELKRSERRVPPVAGSGLRLYCPGLGRCWQSVRCRRACSIPLRKGEEAAYCWSPWAILIRPPTLQVIGQGVHGPYTGIAQGHTGHQAEGDHVLASP